MDYGIPITDEFIKNLIGKAMGIGAISATEALDLLRKVGNTTIEINVDKDLFEEIGEYFVDLTPEVQMALQEAGYPGLAAGITGVRVNPNMDDGRGMAMAMQTRTWFDATKMDPDEDNAFRRAVILAARHHGINLPDPTDGDTDGLHG